MFWSETNREMKNGDRGERKDDDNSWEKDKEAKMDKKGNVTKRYTKNNNNVTVDTKRWDNWDVDFSGKKRKERRQLEQDNKTLLSGQLNSLH